MQNFNDDRDKMAMEDLFKGGKPVDMDWFYLENRIRTFIHDLVTPYAKRTIDAKDQLSDIKDMILVDRKNIDELKMSVLRLRKYDEFFTDCNKKILNTDQLLRTIEKKFKDDINQVNGHKTMMKEKVSQLESELNTFKNQVVERNTEIKFLFDEISHTKETLHQDLINMNKMLSEEMMIQQERIHEVGEKVYSNISYTSKKFQEFQAIDIRLAMHDQTHKEAKDQILELQSQMNEFKMWTSQTDKHLQKYLPLQLSSFIFETLSTNIKNKFRPKLRENFSQIFQTLEQNAKMETQFTGDFNFKKLDYTIPNSFNRLSLNGATINSKILNASLSSVGMQESYDSPKNGKNAKSSMATISGRGDGKTGGKNKSQIRGSRRDTKEINLNINPDQKVFVLHHRARKNPFKGGSQLSTNDPKQNNDNGGDGMSVLGSTTNNNRDKIYMNDEQHQQQQLANIQEFINIASPYQDQKIHRPVATVQGSRSRKPSRARLNANVVRKKQSTDSHQTQLLNSVGSSKQQLNSNNMLNGGHESKDHTPSALRSNQQSYQTITQMSQRQASSNKSTLIKNILQKDQQHSNNHSPNNINADYDDRTPNRLTKNQNQSKQSSQFNNLQGLDSSHGVSRVTGRKITTEQSFMGSKMERSNRDLNEKETIKKTVIVINDPNNPDELRQKVEKAVAAHLDSERQRSMKYNIDHLSRGSSIIKENNENNSSEQKNLGQNPSQFTNFGHLSQNQLQAQSPIMEVALSQELSSPMKPKDQQQIPLFQKEKSQVNTKKRSDQFKLGNIHSINATSTPHHNPTHHPDLRGAKQNDSQLNKTQRTNSKQRTSIVDQLVNRIQESFNGQSNNQKTHSSNDRKNKAVKIPLNSSSKSNNNQTEIVDQNNDNNEDKDSQFNQKRMHAGGFTVKSKTHGLEPRGGRAKVANRDDDGQLDSSIKAFDLEPALSEPLEDAQIHFGKQDLDYDQNNNQQFDYGEEGEYYDEESEGQEFIIEEVDTLNKTEMRQAKRALRQQKKIDGIDEDHNEASDYGSQMGGNSSLDDREYSDDGSRDSYFSQMLFKIQQEMDLMREELKITKDNLARNIKETAIETESRGEKSLKLFKDSMYEVRLQLLDESQRLKRERSDFQLDIKKLRDQFFSYASQIDNHTQSIARVQVWAKQVNDILQLSSIIEAQEERDKQSIALIGLKENANPQSDQNFQSHKRTKEHQVVQLDNKCLTCNNTTSDRAILYSQFKMACLQYRPSTLNYQNKDFTKDEILNQKAKMIIQLQEIELYKEITNSSNGHHHNNQIGKTQSIFDGDDKSMFIHIQTTSPRVVNNNSPGLSTSQQQSQPNSNRRNLLNKTYLMPLSQPSSPSVNTTNFMHSRVKQKNMMESTISNSQHVKFKEIGVDQNMSTLDRSIKQGKNTGGLGNSLNLSQYQARKLNAGRPYSVAETFRAGPGGVVGDGLNTETEISLGIANVATGNYGNSFGKNGFNEQNQFDDKHNRGSVGYSRGHTSMATGNYGQVAGAGGYNRSTAASALGATSVVGKGKLDLSIAENSINNLSVITANNSIEVVPVQTQNRYVGFHQQKKTKMKNK